ncbi:DUF4176 domain-containing protein [Enterococcus termitis]|uniref:DUF4176 domain-containing protein n=1 Tax=Enterococcus termitis TaxID=332950 RepID=A0A1E5H057_9ENTE|nr:DUF4176 domain-containing protein [Enterococcus termitis]OEG18374.1 hypothetical protein BCR25_16225 [Enterococcus termitis]
MNNKILPLGTIVKLKDGDNSELMIIARGSLIEDKGKEVYFDYGAVLIPQGMLAPEAVYFFNKENVETVVFEGFRNEKEEEFEEQYDNMIQNSSYHKGSI